MTNIRRRLRGIIRSAVVWGAGWGALGFLTTLALEITGVVHGVGVLDALGMGIRIGVVGGIAGGLFSTLIAVAYRGKRLQDISWVKFGLGGAVFSAVGLPLFMETASILSGGGVVPLRNLYTDIALFAVFGGVAAGLSMKMAQVAALKDDALLDDAPVDPQLRRGEAARGDLHSAVGQRVYREER